MYRSHLTTKKTDNRATIGNSAGFFKILKMQLFAWKLQSTLFLYKVIRNVVSDVLTYKRNHFNSYFYVFISWLDG